MRLRRSVILIALTLLAALSSTAATMPVQHQHGADEISGEWDATLITDENNVQMTLTLKLEGDKVMGSFESAHLGSGAIKNGSWASHKLTITFETDHAPLTLTGALQNGKLTGEWNAVQMQGKWEAKKKH